MKFSRNLSRISQPCVRAAAMVVSEIIDRLSPNIAPQTTAAMHTGSEIPACSLMPMAIGCKATIVPTEVPIEVEIKQPIRNSPTTTILLGRMARPNATAASAPPAALTDAENAPASKKIMHIIIMFSSPAPRARIPSFSASGRFGFWKNATSSAIKKPTAAGIT